MYDLAKATKQEIAQTIVTKLMANRPAELGTKVREFLVARGGSDKTALYYKQRLMAEHCMGFCLAFSAYILDDEDSENFDAIVEVDSENAELDGFAAEYDVLVGEAKIIKILMDSTDDVKLYAGFLPSNLYTNGAEDFSPIADLLETYQEQIESFRIYQLNSALGI